MERLTKSSSTTWSPPRGVLLPATALSKVYLRYLTISQRDIFDLPGVPIRLKLRKGEIPYDRG